MLSGAPQSHPFRSGLFKRKILRIRERSTTRTGFYLWRRYRKSDVQYKLRVSAKNANVRADSIKIARFRFRAEKSSFFFCARGFLSFRLWPMQKVNTISTPSTVLYVNFRAHIVRNANSPFRSDGAAIKFDIGEKWCVAFFPIPCN